MMSLWQRAGRVGRSGQPGSVILIPEARPIDAYYTEHPDELFARPNEPLAINTQSPTLAKWHYACALNEAGGDFTRVRPEDLGEPMETIARNHQEGRMDDTIFHSDQPHCFYDLRAGGDSVYALVLEGGLDVGQINKSQIQLETAPHAIYLHGGEHYRVQWVRERPNQVQLRREHSYNRTQAYVHRSVRVLNCMRCRGNADLKIEQCDRLRVTESLVSLTEKTPNGTVVNVYQGSQGLAPFVLPTTGVVLTLTDPVAFVQRRSDPSATPTGAKTAWNGLETLLTGMLPSVLGPCDLGDFAIASEWEGTAARLYFYDKAYDGIDLTLPAYDRMSKLLEEAYDEWRNASAKRPEGVFGACVIPLRTCLPRRTAPFASCGRCWRRRNEDPLTETVSAETRKLFLDPADLGPKCPGCGKMARVGARLRDHCGKGATGIMSMQDNWDGWLSGPLCVLRHVTRDSAQQLGGEPVDAALIRRCAYQQQGLYVAGCDAERAAELLLNGAERVDTGLIWVVTPNDEVYRAIRQEAGAQVEAGDKSGERLVYDVHPLYRNADDWGNGGVRLLLNTAVQLRDHTTGNRADERTY